MTHPPARGDTGPSCYEIRLHGQLDQRWSDWFGGFELTNLSDGTTTLTGPVADQAALHGLLRRVGDLGVTLISLNITHGSKDDHHGPNE
ncbi:hypothetical protein SAMN04487846_0766 [Microbacterium sp. cf046]|uniref:hypothetical protein n=1 Tax=Microbacterium sp. cf046 TaxID=1761803 RepID=UPI0008ECCA14|nr:hypothetical protein [Microbacterium sp. cf046]SFR93209.1 hypothetical protein SAMN04487846_0766 [Microbacterium sp. cf046]